MACVTPGSKADAFRRQGQAWFCTTGLPSDVIIKVGDMSFHLHKFPLLSRSGLLERKIKEAPVDSNADCFIRLSDVPGGVKSFELVAKFCYGMKLEFTAETVVYLRCAAEHLQMTEDYGENNLISQTEIFIDEVVLQSWKDSMTALRASEDLLPEAEDLYIVQRCIESLALKAGTDPNICSWPMEHGPMQSPGGSVLWNGISTGARVRNYASDWWYEDVACLSLPIYKRLISRLESSGTRQEIIVGSLACYAKMYLPGLKGRQAGSDHGCSLAVTALPSEEQQKVLLEEIVRLLPVKKGLASTRFLFGLLRSAFFLRADSSCMENLERVIGMQLDQAMLEDLLMPNFSYSMEPLYNIDCVQRMVEYFLAMETERGSSFSPCSVENGELVDSQCASIVPIYTVAKLVDGFLAEVAPDANLKLPKFQSLASAIPAHARPLEDGLYRAIDIYLKAHPWLTDSDREQLCRLMDCQKLSLEACTHATQNERLPLRTIVQVLFFEQVQLRSCIASCYLVSGNMETSSRQLRTIGGGFEGSEYGNTTENHVLRLGMDSMRLRVSELEKECRSMRREIGKLGDEKNVGRSKAGKFGFKLRPQMCSSRDDAISGDNKEKGVDGGGKVKRLQAKLPKHKNVSPTMSSD